MNGGVPGADIKFEDGLWCVRACQSFRVRLRPVLVARAFLRVKNVALSVSVSSLFTLSFVSRRWDVALLI